ncbi:MAG: DnaJ domain-containing protein [Nitrosopumilaceae archaeon]
MKKIPLFFVLIITSFFTTAFGQEDIKSNKLIVSDEDQIILFTIAILIVVGIVIFMARNIIRRKKTSYDKGDFGSKKNKDYEKYHSDWSDDYEELGSKTLEDDEFRNAANVKSLPNYYEILGLEKNATPTEIKQRFRQLAKELHPDKTKNPDTESKMAEINKAYEILSNQEKRERYDKYLNV